jgi:hypothetical protein
VSLVVSFSRSSYPAWCVSVVAIAIAKGTRYAVSEAWNAAAYELRGITHWVRTRLPRSVYLASGGKP